MYTSIQEFIDEWSNEAASTQKVLDALTDSSLGQKVSPENRTLGAFSTLSSSRMKGLFLRSSKIM